MTKKIPLPPKEEFYKLYITDNLSKTQLTKHYKVGMSTIESWIRQFNIVKRATERLYQLPTKEDFFEQYHTKNLSAKELCEYYKVPEHIIRRWAQHFNFSKTSKEIGEIRAKAFYERHGVYNPSQLAQVVETAKIVFVCPPFGDKTERWAGTPEDMYYDFHTWCNLIKEHVKAPNYIFVGPEIRTKSKYASGITPSGLFRKKHGIMWYPQYSLHI